MKVPTKAEAFNAAVFAVICGLALVVLGAWVTWEARHPASLLLILLGLLVVACYGWLAWIIYHHPANRDTQ